MNLPIEQVNQKFEELGLLVQGQPVSFNRFKYLCDIHTYGKGSRKLYIFFVGHPKENMFAFYPPTVNKVESLKIAYDYYLDTVLTEMKQEYLDKNVMWGNKGIPLSYSELRN